MVSNRLVFQAWVRVLPRSVPEFMFIFRKLLSPNVTAVIFWSVCIFISEAAGFTILTDHLPENHLFACLMPDASIHP